MVVYEIRRFVFFWLARVFSAVSLQVSMVAVGRQVYSLTGSAFKLAWWGLPSSCLWSFCRLRQGTSPTALDMAQIYAVVALLGASRSLEHPKMSAPLPKLVGESLLPRAAARMASATQTACIIGPAPGGRVRSFPASPSALLKLDVRWFG